MTATQRPPGEQVGVGLVVSLLAALWSASSSTGNLMKAVNLAEERPA